MKRSITLMAGLLLAATIATNAQAIDNTKPLPVEVQNGKIIDTSEGPVWLNTQEWRNAISASLQVYPNPSNGEFTVQLSEQITVSEIDIYDLTGRLVQERKGEKVIGASGIRIDLSAQQSGMYLLVLRNGEDTYVHRLVKL